MTATPDPPSVVAPMGMWLEITDRAWDELGDNINVRCYQDNGNRRMSAILAEKMLPGDIVFHWWRVEHPSAIVGWSVVVGHPEIIWNEADSTPEDDLDGDPPVSAMLVEGAYDEYHRRTVAWVPLEWQNDIAPPITLRDVQSRSEQVINLQQRLKEHADGRPTYFPFQGDRNHGIKSAAPQYLARFPAPLLDILPGLPSVETLTTAASAAVRTAQTSRVENAAVRAVLAEYATAHATAYFVAEGCAVTDVSAFSPHTLLVIKEGEPWQVWVIGSAAEDLEDVEIDLAMASNSALVVVDQIAVQSEDFPNSPHINAMDGRFRLWWPWIVSASNNASRRYVSRLAPAMREMPLLSPIVVY